MKSKQSIRRTLAAVLAATMLFCGAFVATAGATTYDPVVEAAQEIIIEPFASEHISSWTPLLSRNLYGASVSFTGSRTGTIRVELQNSAGNTIASFTDSFSSVRSVTATRARNTPSGTYRIRITVTINGSATQRTSHWFII